MKTLPKYGRAILWTLARTEGGELPPHTAEGDGVWSGLPIQMGRESFRNNVMMLADQDFVNATLTDGFLMRKIALTEKGYKWVYGFYADHRPEDDLWTKAVKRPYSKRQARSNRGIPRPLVSTRPVPPVSEEIRQQTIDAIALAGDYDGFDNTFVVRPKGAMTPIHQVASTLGMAYATAAVRLNTLERLGEPRVVRERAWPTRARWISALIVKESDVSPEAIARRDGYQPPPVVEERVPDPPPVVASEPAQGIDYSVLSTALLERVGEALRQREALIAENLSLISANDDLYQDNVALREKIHTLEAQIEEFSKIAYESGFSPETIDAIRKVIPPQQ